LSEEKKIIIGCGNLLLGDEGIGVHLIEYLKQKDIPDDIELIDGGTAGFELIDFIGQSDKVIIVDAVKAGGRAGQIYFFGPEDFECDNAPKTSLHGLSLKDVFAAIKQLGCPAKAKIIGIEPAEIKPCTKLSRQLRQMLPGLAEITLKETENF